MCTCQEVKHNAALPAGASQEMSGNKKGKKWMQKAVKRPGSFTAYAKKHGGLDADGKIKVEWAKSLIGDKAIDARIRQKANLFLTFVGAH